MSKVSGTAKNRKNGGELFISRELSWLDFNSRVLDEAAAPANPLMERLKFIAIVSSNLDEFFMVRIAGLRQLVKAGQEIADFAGNTPSRQLELARRKIIRLQRRQSAVLLDEVLPALEERGIRLRTPAELPPDERRSLDILFREEILPVLTPLAVDRSHPFPSLNSGELVIAAALAPRGKHPRTHAFIEVPEVLGRFVRVPDEAVSGRRTFVLLEDLIRAELPVLFPDAVIEESFAFRITRDMEFDIGDDAGDGSDLLQSIGKKLRERIRRDVIRIELPVKSQSGLAGWLMEQLKVDREDRYIIRGPLHLKQFFFLTSLIRDQELYEEPWPPVVPSAFTAEPDIFKAVTRQGSILLAPPFHSFSPLVDFLNQAADDPDVLAIKHTLYRVSGNSPVVKALQRAAERGKQVTVLVELKARFDESNNIAWARALDDSGAHVVYGVADLKVHCKSLLVVRRENGVIRRYVHLGTGNYNDKTAALYTDLGILSCDPDLCYDVANLFNVLTGCAPPPEKWRKVAVAPFDLRRRLEFLIHREIEHAVNGGEGRIIAKMNSLSDEKMIRLLHRAADAGVKIDLIVRGICCYRMRPGQENLRIISIVDRFLEHSRVFVFHNGGDEEFYLGSADMMSRNLDRRIELMFPVEDPAIRTSLRKLLELQLADSDKCRRMKANGTYGRCRTEEFNGSRSQELSYRYFRDQAAAELRGGRGGLLHIFTRRRR